jgi:hypothetical protein
MSISQDVLRRSRDPQYSHLYSKTHRNYRLCSEEFYNYRYSESILNAYEVLEFFWKSIYYLDSGSYPPQHLPSRGDLSTVSSFLNKFLNTTQISKINNIFSTYNPRWQSNPTQRMQPRYGDEKRGIPPSKLFTHRLTNSAVINCGVLTEALSKIHRTILSYHSERKILILNGKVTTSSAEKRCHQYPHADGLDVNKWYYNIKKIPNTSVNRLPISIINNSYSIVINPFGESYPEKPNTLEDTPAFNLICDYIFNGGVFITAGGLPFTYYWDVNSGTQISANTVVPNYPTQIIWNGPQIEVRETTLLLNNLLEKKFNIMTTMDDPNQNHVGPISIIIRQNREDMTYWHCNSLENSFIEFRSIDPQRSSSAVPVIRATRYGNEVWPVAFVRYGYGFLMHIGLDLINQNECSFAISVLKGLITNYQSYFS